MKSIRIATAASALLALAACNTRADEEAAENMDSIPLEDPIDQASDLEDDTETDASSSGRDSVSITSGPDTMTRGDSNAGGAGIPARNKLQKADPVD